MCQKKNPVQLSCRMCVAAELIANMDLIIAQKAFWKKRVIILQEQVPF